LPLYRKELKSDRGWSSVLSITEKSPDFWIGYVYGTEDGTDLGSEFTAILFKRRQGGINKRAWLFSQALWRI